MERVEAGLTPTRSASRRPAISTVADVALHLTLLVVSIVTFGPFVWMILGSLKTSGEIVQIPPTFLPHSPNLDSFGTIFTQLAFARYFINSLITCTCATASVLLTSSLTGYVLAKYRFFGRDQLFLVILGTLMIPFSVVMLPLFLLMKDVSWINTYQGLIVPGAVSSFGIFLMRQFIDSVPTELIEAARIDGAGEAWIYARVVVPLSTSAFATLAIFIFMWNWDSFLWPLIVVNSPEMRTLTLGLVSLSTLERGMNYAVSMAGSTITVLPIVLVYAAAQRHFIRGITVTGMK